MIYLLEDVDVLVDTEDAAQCWTEGTAWDGGAALVSLATRNAVHHETLYESPSGRYYVVGTSEWPDEPDYAVALTRAAAARWLTINRYDPAEALR
jgi:hypothetical protein